MNRNNNNNNKLAIKTFVTPANLKGILAAKRSNQPRQGNNAGSRRRRNKKSIGMNSNPQVGAASAYSQLQNPGTAYQLRSADGRSHRVVHSELINGAVTGSASFTVFQRVALNPGLVASFPWLAPIAKQWQQYRFRRLCFRYVTRQGSNTPGSVSMAPDYDASNPSPGTEQEMSTFQDIVEDSSWKNIECRLDPNAMHPSGPRKYVRSNLVANTDIKTYDVGNLIIATNDGGATSVGKLWVDYDVEFYVPQSTSASDAQISTSASFYSQHASESFTTATPKVVIFDTLVVDPIGVGAGSAGTFTPPAGTYEIHTQCTFNDTAAEDFQVDLEILKNGISLSSPLKSRMRVVGAGARCFTTTVLGVVPCSGTDTIAISATLTGAAGTLTALADSSQLLLKLV